jgi:hypothetical protein
MPRFIKNILLLSYGWVTLLAFILTMTKVSVPLAPRRLVLWSYGMMAPYQGDTDWNGELVLYGKLPDGTVHQLALEEYLPYGFGELNVRQFLRVYQVRGELAHKEQFTKLGLQLLEHERAQGRPYQLLTLAMHRWERSPAGYYYLHTPLFTEVQPLTQVRLNP